MSKHPVKPQFDKDQIVTASEAVRKFSETRKRAKNKPLFILDGGNVDSVILSYPQYEEFFSELTYLREKASDYSTSPDVEKDGVKND